MTQSNIISVITWAVPIVFGAGALYHALNTTADAIDHLQTAVESHTQLAGHPVTMSKMEEMERNQQTIMAEQRELLQDVSAICQATGADCR